MPYLIVFFIVFIVLLSMAIAGFWAAPWLPTFGRDLKSAVDLAEIKAGDLVYDLGCGDGRFLFLAAKNNPSAEFVGFEISVLPFCLASVRKLFLPYGRQIKLKFGNFFKADFAKADAVYCFLMPRVMPKLEKIISPQMKPGSRLVSYSFKLPSRPPEKIFRQNAKSLPIYLYRF